MKKTQVERPVDALIDELEYSLSETYGSRFVIDLQEMCGMHTLKAYFGKGAETENSKKIYAAMLRGAWYASNEQKLKKK